MHRSEVNSLHSRGAWGHSCLPWLKKAEERQTDSVTALFTRKPSSRPHEPSPILFKAIPNLSPDSHAWDPFINKVDSASPSHALSNLKQNKLGIQWQQLGEPFVIVIVTGAQESILSLSVLPTVQKSLLCAHRKLFLPLPRDIAGLSFPPSLAVRQDRILVIGL